MRFTGIASVRKIISLVLSASMVLMLCACGKTGLAKDSGRLKIVTTIFPEYDWVKQIAGDVISGIDLTLLADNGVDIHSFQPTAKDIIDISSCDVFIYVGGESDEWVKDALSEAVNKDMQVVNLMDILGGRVKEEEIVEGMEAEDEDEGEIEYDEHIWLSLKNTAVLVTGVADAMCKADPGNAGTYRSNAEEYNKKLSELDKRYEEVAASSVKDTLLFGDRFPFRYLADDYGLNYYAAFAGCSAETEASFETVVFLSGKIDELGLKAVLVIEGEDHSIAQTIIDNTKTKDQSILVMDSMQSTSSSDNITYITIMENNLASLTKALG